MMIEQTKIRVNSKSAEIQITQKCRNPLLLGQSVENVFKKLQVSQKSFTIIKNNKKWKFFMSKAVKARLGLLKFFSVRYF
jgi:hypothetical protein